jgi:hypothetical protein
MAAKITREALAAKLEQGAPVTLEIGRAHV